MTPRRSATIGLRAAAVGLGFAVAFSGDAVLSGRAWAMATAATAVVFILRDFVAAAGVEPAGMRPAWVKPPPPKQVHGTKDLRAVSMMLAGAITNPRAHGRHLRPRLIALAEHFLPIRCGIDFLHDPEGGAALLGDVAWLIDEAADDERVPTVAEVARFLERIGAAEDQPTGEAGP